MTSNNYKKYYSEKSFMRKLQRIARTAGIQVVYAALLLYFMMKDEKVPLKTKVTIAAALGYFILPADLIPDIAPLVGFTDDLGVLIFALSRISDQITEEIHEKARLKLHTWFKQVDESEIDELQGKIF